MSPSVTKACCTTKYGLILWGFQSCRPVGLEAMGRNSSQLGTSDPTQKPSLSALHTALGRTLEMDMPVDTEMKRLFTPSGSR